MQVLVYLCPVLAFMSGWWWWWWYSCLSLISYPWYLLCSSQVACPAPPCAWLPSLPALHLLGAWPAPCCFRSCLSNHVYWLWLLVLVWWCEFTLDAQLMSRENYLSADYDCSQWCVSDLCWCGCAGAIASMLVMLCWWGCAGDDVLVRLCWWCGSTRVLGRPVSHTVTLLYFPLSSGALTPPCMHLVTMLLASWVAWLASLVLGWYFASDSCW
jgi:hypothetical protein